MAYGGRLWSVIPAEPLTAACGSLVGISGVGAASRSPELREPRRSPKSRPAVGLRRSIAVGCPRVREFSRLQRRRTSARLGGGERAWSAAWRCQPPRGRLAGARISWRSLSFHLGSAPSIHDSGTSATPHARMRDTESPLLHLVPPKQFMKRCRQHAAGTRSRDGAGRSYAHDKTGRAAEYVWTTQLGGTASDHY